MVPAIWINLDSAAKQGGPWAAFAVSSIVFGAVCVEVAVFSVEDRKYMRTILYGLLAIFFISLNVLNAIGNAATFSEGSRDDRTSQIQGKQELQEKLASLSQARKTQVAVAGEATPESITSEIQAAKAADANRWNASGQCDIAQITIGATRAFCSNIASLEAKLAAARARVQIDEKKALLDKQAGAAAPSSADPFAENIASFLGLLGYEVDGRAKILIRAAQDWGKAIGVELLAGFGPAGLLLLLGRPARGKAGVLQTSRAVTERTQPEEEDQIGAAVVLALQGDGEADPEMHSFVERKLERCAGEHMMAAPLYQLWIEDCSSRAANPGSPKAFSKRIRRYFEHDRNSGRPRYLDVRPKTDYPAIRMVVSR
jgi:hypothetical protein